MAGYSDTPLVRKLGIQEDFRIRTLNAPGNYRDLVDPLPPGAVVSDDLHSDVDLWHLFTTDYDEMEHVLPQAMQQLKPRGMIWVSWPKRAARVPTNVTEDRIREVALPLGLVDVKVCAVDETWSALKLVVRRHPGARSSS